MPYRVPQITFKEVRDTLSQGYGVVFTPKLIAPEGTKKTFMMMYCLRRLGSKELVMMYEDEGDDAIISWDLIDNICRLMHIDRHEDGLFGGAI
jgi:hypothetical protein